MITYMLEDSDRQSSFHCQTGAACVHRHVSPLLSWKRGREPPNRAIAPPANVSQYELHALLQVAKFQSGCPVVFGSIRFGKNRQAAPRWRGGITQSASPPSTLRARDRRDCIRSPMPMPKVQSVFPFQTFLPTVAVCRFNIDLLNHSLAMK